MVGRCAYSEEQVVMGEAYARTLIVLRGRKAKVKVRLPLGELGRRHVVTPISGGVVHRDPVDRGRRVLLDGAHLAVRQRGRKALHLDDVSVRLRVLRLGSLQRAAATNDQVVVAVLAIGNFDLVSAAYDVGGDK